MYRSVAVIVCAILQSQPHMRGAETYAKTIQTEAVSRHFDPLTLVAMAHHESCWLARARNGSCMGLVGVCLSSYQACSDLSSEGCQKREACLLNGSCNLREAAKAITLNRVFCRRKTGSANFHHWLASYQGFNRGGVWCGQRLVQGRWVDTVRSRLTSRVMDRQRWLELRCAR